MEDVFPYRILRCGSIVVSPSPSETAGHSKHSKHRTREFRFAGCWCEFESIGRRHSKISNVRHVLACRGIRAAVLT